MSISDLAIARYALRAGFPEPAAVTAVAVALAESGGDPDAHNDTPPDDSYGLWQINMLGYLGPARRRQFGIGLDAELLHPAVNAHAAWLVSGGGRSWRPWSTWLHGTHRQFLGRAEVAVADAARPVPVPAPVPAPGVLVLRRRLRLRVPRQYGDDVRAVQAVVRCRADGWFGRATDGHVRSFQRARGLLVDGIVGPQTAHAMGFAWQER